MRALQIWVVTEVAVESRSKAGRVDDVVVVVHDDVLLHLHQELFWGAMTRLRLKNLPTRVHQDFVFHWTMKLH